LCSPDPTRRPTRSCVGVAGICDPIASQQLGWQAFETLRHRQASALAYCDCFWIFAVLTFVPAFTALLMKRAVAEKGAHPVSE
jgi:MFS transporter, DHA2 family, multidrug resistance protein